MKTTAYPPILNYLCQLTAGKDSPSVDSVLQRLIEMLDVNGVGVSCLDDPSMDCFLFTPATKSPETRPWQTDGKQVPTPCDLAVHSSQDAGGNWLMCRVREPREGTPLIAWLYRPSTSLWSDADQTLWPVVAQTLVRWMSNPSELRTEASLRRNLEQTAVLTSRLSHDFGNYLTGILGFTELALTQVPGGTTPHRYMQEVLLSARQGAEWIRRLHWFCRRSDHSTWPAELNSVVEETRTRMPAILTPRWETTVPPDLPLIAIDATSLLTALAELAKNGSESCKGAGTLTIAARNAELTEADCRSLLGTPRPGHYVQISVNDDGPGFSPEMRAKLFREPFVSSKPRHRGLGLLMVYGIMHRFHGGMHISTNEQPGVQVRLYLPVVKVGARVSADANAHHILVVHPDPLVSGSLRKLLEWQGYRVTVATSSLVALSIYQAAEQAFALVLAESVLPQLSGFDLARRILDRDSKARFVFLHTQSSFNGVAEEELLKRFALLRWPLEPAALLQAVQASFERAK